MKYCKKHGGFHSGSCEDVNATLISPTDELVRCLEELLEASEIDGCDLPNHEYEEIVTDAKRRARELLVKYA